MKKELPRPAGYSVTRLHTPIVLPSHKIAKGCNLPPSGFVIIIFVSLCFKDELILIMSTPGCRVVLLFAVVYLFTSCSPFRASPKYGFAEGYYKARLNDSRPNAVYVVPSADTIKVYIAKENRNETIDSVKGLQIAYPQINEPSKTGNRNFIKNTLDVDVLTIPFKFRPSVNGFPRQLNASFNGAVYIGFRSDRYRLYYKRTPLGINKREVTHFGYSFGLFTGIGTARIDEYVTNNAIAIQYDGAVHLAGIAFIVAVENIGVGLALGIDHLLDKNHRFWVNQQKPWLGLSFGLNLN